MKHGLILIDIQNDYFTGGKMALVGMDKAANNAKKLLDKFRKEKLPIFHVQHISKRAGAAFFLPDTEGVKIHESVAPLPNEMIVQKNFPNSFRDTSLLHQLNDANIEEIVICGAMSHMCVDATTRCCQRPTAEQVRTDCVPQRMGLCAIHPPSVTAYKC